jgi:hypothetical protein
MRIQGIISATFTLLLSALFLSTFAQKNETYAGYYNWKGKKTEFQDGYVVLKSGKKMTGKISLKGSPGAIEEFVFSDGTKEVTIPSVSIAAYGLTGFVNPEPAKPSAPPPMSVADCDPEFFIMSDVTTSNGVGMPVRSTTKPRNGYVVLRNGTRIEGELKIIYYDGNLNNFEIKNDQGKEDLFWDKVKNYGVNLTIADITDDGKKVFDEPGRNFREGTIETTDGGVRTGIVGFYRTTNIDPKQPSLGRYYSAILFTTTKTGILEPVSEANVSKVTQEVYGVRYEYMPYEVGFVEKTQFDQLDYKDETKMFQEGEITLDDGTVLQGSVLQQKGSLGWFSSSILFKDPAGNTRKYSPMTATAFTQKIDGKPTKFMGYKGAFVELMFEGNNFQLFRNPYPTSVNEFFTGLAQIGTQIAGTVVQDELAKNTLPPNASKEDMQQRVDDVQRKVKSMSVPELQSFVQQCSDAKGAVDVRVGATPFQKLMNQLIGIATAEMAMRAAVGSIEIKKKEWIFLNRKTEEELVVTLKGYGDQVEPLLGSCPEFLLMSKKEQNQINNFDAIDQAIRMLDKCYDEE